MFLYVYFLLIFVRNFVPKTRAKPVNKSKTVDVGVTNSTKGLGLLLTPPSS